MRTRNYERKYKINCDNQIPKQQINELMRSLRKLAIAYKRSLA